MKTRKKTSKEVRADVENATEKLNHLYKISEEFIETFVECDGEVSYKEVIKLRNAVWFVDHAKRRLSQTNVSEQLGLSSVGKATYIGVYDG